MVDNSQAAWRRALRLRTSEWVSLGIGVLLLVIAVLLMSAHQEKTDTVIREGECISVEVTDKRTGLLSRLFGREAKINYELGGQRQTSDIRYSPGQLYEDTAMVCFDRQDRSVYFARDYDASSPSQWHQSTISLTFGVVGLLAIVLLLATRPWPWSKPPAWLEKGPPKRKKRRSERR